MAHSFPAWMVPTETVPQKEEKGPPISKFKEGDNVIVRLNGAEFAALVRAEPSHETTLYLLVCSKRPRLPFQASEDSMRSPTGNAEWKALDV